MDSAKANPAATNLGRRDLLRSAAAIGISCFRGREVAATDPAYWPRANEWESRKPAEAGMDADAVEAALAYAGEHNSTGMVILRGGRIVAEHYWQAWNPESSAPIFSASKSLTATLVGMAIEEGKLKSLNQSAADFVTSWKGTPKAAITLRHMLTMTSGIRVTAGNVRSDVDAFEETAASPLDHAPGEFWAYNTPVYRMLIRVLEIASGVSIDQYTQRKLSGPLGMNHSQWDCSPAPKGKTNCTWYRSSLRDMSRFGLMILRNGKWESKQLISAKYVKEASSTSQKLNESYGYLWWLNGRASYKLPAGGAVQPGMMWPDCPSDSFGALGAQDKKIYIVPSLDLVVSRHGGAAGVARGPGAEGGGRSSFDNELLGRICRAVKR